MKKKIYTRKTCCDVSYQRLQKLYRKIFDQLGWMILAKEYHMKEEINIYVTSVYRILAAIQEAQRTSKHKTDLEHMENNVKILLAHIQKDFK
jgi:regulation of enolase protein 1 (concanavalin A-like superfamily)